jgi:hypothetical protein
MCSYFISRLPRLPEPAIIGSISFVTGLTGEMPYAKEIDRNGFFLGRKPLLKDEITPLGQPCPVGGGGACDAPA